MKLPRGTLVRKRVVSDPGTVLETALDRRLTGYARLESQDAILLDGEGVGILTFERGVPQVAYHTGTDRGGTRALADIAVHGPYQLELFELETEALARVNETPELRVPPEMPADRLAGDVDLAERTNAAAPETDGADRHADAVEAFLDDEATIRAIRQQARAEARERADELGI